jgi:hypothetical protein
MLQKGDHDKSYPISTPHLICFLYLLLVNIITKSAKDTQGTLAVHGYNDRSDRKSIVVNDVQNAGAEVAFNERPNKEKLATCNAFQIGSKCSHSKG